MWELKTTIIPEVIGDLGMINKGIKNHVSKIPGHISIPEQENITLRVTSHIIRKTLFI